jgi:glycosyltransferase involved in cell wall biosynthesis
MVSTLVLEQIAAVVIGRNEGKRLHDCLSSLREKLKCIVYVDSGSTDDSRKIADRAGVNVLSLNTDRPFTAARARNEGFAFVRGLRPDIPLVQFIDGDCELDDDWLANAANFLRQHCDVAVVCGRRRERYPLISIYNRLCDIEWNTPTGETYTCGGDSLIRAEAFECVSGFCEQLIAGEEPELCVRLREKGWKIWRLDADMTIHDAAMTQFVQWWRRGIRSGYGITDVVLQHWRSPFCIWKRELSRSILWGGVVPFLTALAAMVHPIMLAILVVYPLQICRIALTRTDSTRDSWAYATLMMLAKFAEFQGISKFCWRTLRRQAASLIEYK